MARSSPDEKIAYAALDLLRHRGPKAVTVEAVAAATGVAKTTIYRRFSDRDEMLRSALAPLAVLDPVAPDAPIGEQLRWVVEQTLQTVDDGIGFGGLAALLTDDDPRFTALFRELLTKQRKYLTEVVEAGMAAGSVRPNVSAETLLDAVVGTYIAERARTGTAAPGIVGRTLDLLIPAILVEG